MSIVFDVYCFVFYRLDTAKEKKEEKDHCQELPRQREDF